LNDRDLLLQNIRANKNGLIAKVLPATSDVEPDSRLVVWDIVLDRGVRCSHGSMRPVFSSSQR
jgi:hypothetical protein